MKTITGSKNAIKYYLQEHGGRVIKVKKSKLNPHAYKVTIQDRLTKANHSIKY